MFWTSTCSSSMTWWMLKQATDRHTVSLMFYLLIYFNSIMVWVSIIQLNHFGFDLDSSHKSVWFKCDTSPQWWLESVTDYNSILGDGSVITSLTKSPFCWCVCVGTVEYILWCFGLVVLLAGMSVLPYFSSCYLALPLFSLTWSLNSVSSPLVSVCFSMSNLRFRPRNSVLAPSKGSANTRTTTGLDRWGGWVSPSVGLPVGFVCLCHL